jgi:hypothetical protein
MFEFFHFFIKYFREKENVPQEKLKEVVFATKPAMGACIFQK